MLRMPMPGNPDSVVISPNITADLTTGVIANWSADDCIARFKEVGKTVPQSHLPWSAFAQVSDDRRAIYNYLMSLEPVENETGPLLQAAK